MAGDFDPYYTWLGIPPEEQPPHHYRLLGIRALEGNADVIHNAADRIMAQLRTYQTGQHSPESQKLLNEVAGARVCLLNPAKKAAYDAALQQKLAPQQATEAPAVQDRVDASTIGITEAWTPHILSPVAHARPRESVPIHRRPWFLPAAFVVGLWCLVLALLPWALWRRGASPPVPLADKEASPESVRKPRSLPTIPAAPAIPDKEKAGQGQTPLATPSPVSGGAPAGVSPPSGTGMSPSDSAEFVGHIIPAGHIDFTSDGKRMLSAPMGFRLARMEANQPREIQFDSLRIWDVETRHCLAEIPFHPEGNAFVYTARFSADGRQVIWVQTSSIRIWDWETKRDVRVVPLDEASGAALAPDHRHMLVTHRQGDPLRLWDLDTGQVVHRVPGVAQNRVHRLVLSANGRFVMVFPGGSELHVIDRQTDTERLLQADHRGPTGAADFSPDGRWAISCVRFISADRPGEKEMRVWDLQTGQVVRHLKGHTYPVRFVHVSPRGTRAVSISQRFEGVLWNMENGSELSRFGGVYDALFNADGSRLVLVAAKPPPTLRLWELGELAGPQKTVNVLDWPGEVPVTRNGR